MPSRRGIESSDSGAAYAAFVNPLPLPGYAVPITMSSTAGSEGTRYSLPFRGHANVNALVEDDRAVIANRIEPHDL